MGSMKNHPNDTRSKRLLSKKPARAKDWLLRGTRKADQPLLAPLFQELMSAGAKDIHVGEVGEADNGDELLESVIVTLPGDDNRERKIVRAITAFETALGAEKPADGVGFQFALVQCIR